MCSSDLSDKKSASSTTPTTDDGGGGKAGVPHEANQAKQEAQDKEERGNDAVALKAGAGSDQLVRCLVQANIAVYEIAQAQESLENFYLNLMNGEAKGN